MAKNHPSRKVGLIGFDNTVKLFGDGSEENPEVIRDDSVLGDEDKIKQVAAQSAQRCMQNSVSDAEIKLIKLIDKLSPGGCTALGPAVLSAAVLAGNGKPGSQVIICTDGMANVGLGQFRNYGGDANDEQANRFYDMVGKFAQEKGVAISIISIIGDECNLNTLSRMAEFTGGNVERVDPIQLKNNVVNLMTEPIIATNVVAKIKLHKGLCFRNEDPANLQENETMMVRLLGNVSKQTEITFEYTLKKIRELAKMEDVDFEKLTHLPF